MPRTAKPEYLDSLKAQCRRLRERIADEEAKKRKANRKRETRLKILLGAAILADAAFHDSTRATFKEIAARAITIPRDRQFLAEAGWIDGTPPGVQPHFIDYRTERQTHQVAAYLTEPRGPQPGPSRPVE